MDFVLPCLGNPAARRVIGPDAVAALPPTKARQIRGCRHQVVLRKHICNFRFFVVSNCIKKGGDLFRATQKCKTHARACRARWKGRCRVTGDGKPCVSLAAPSLGPEFRPARQWISGSNRRLVRPTRPLKITIGDFSRAHMTFAGRNICGCHPLIQGRVPPGRLVRVAYDAGS